MVTQGGEKVPKNFSRIPQIHQNPRPEEPVGTPGDDEGQRKSSNSKARFLPFPLSTFGVRVGMTPFGGTLQEPVREWLAPIIGGMRRVGLMGLLVLCAGAAWLAPQRSIAATDLPQAQPRYEVTVLRGTSYPGGTQHALALSNPPYLKAMIPADSMSDFGRYGVRHNGAFELRWMNWIFNLRIALV
jgi:hypothetical protein